MPPLKLARRLLVMLASVPRLAGARVSVPPTRGLGVRWQVIVLFVAVAACEPARTGSAGSTPEAPAVETGTALGLGDADDVEAAYRADLAGPPLSTPQTTLRADKGRTRAFVRHEGPLETRDWGAPSVISKLTLDSTATLERGELPPLALPLPADGGERPSFERPQHIRGLYVNAPNAGSVRRMRQLMGLAARTEINSFVIDIKDVSGRISHRSAVPLANEIGAAHRAPVGDLLGLLRELEARKIYPIARIVVVKDALLAEARPDLAIQDTAGGPWADSKGVVWMNPWNQEMWEYPIALAREALLAGFPEIQWDYVRFPDAPQSDKARAVYPGKDHRPESEVIRAFLEYGRERLAELDPVITADVFGVTTTATRDVGIGQLWEDFIDVVDVALPMVYPSHYWTGSYGFERPNFHPYEIVNRAVRDAVERSAAIEGAGLVRPWLQDFDYTEPDYDAPEVRAQIQGTYDAGIREWILWHPGSRYTEEALRPAGADEGWEESVPIRVGGVIVPASERHEALRAWAGAADGRDPESAGSGNNEDAPRQ